MKRIRVYGTTMQGSFGYTCIEAGAKKNLVCLSLCLLPLPLTFLIIFSLLSLHPSLSPSFPLFLHSPPSLPFSFLFSPHCIHPTELIHWASEIAAKQRKYFVMSRLKLKPVGNLHSHLGHIIYTFWYVENHNQDVGWPDD